MSNTVTALFETRPAMEAALHKIELLGVTQQQIGVIMNDDMRAKTFSIETHNKENAGMATGATVGGIAAGILAAVVSVGTVAIPGVNLVFAGALVSGLAGAGAGAAIGGFIGGLIGMGIPEHEAKLYEGKVKEGHIMLLVDCWSDDQESEVRKVLKNTDALQVAA
jgi:hypothetical protein